jgi:adenosylcobyric acid synthase
VRGAILVCGTHSDAGKSVVAAGLCRWMARGGVRVAPFKAQNMALNSVVTEDGCEVGRSQAVQAAAAGVKLEAAMNPILIKPSGSRRSQVVVMGHPYADADARSYQELKDELGPIVGDALADLRTRFDVVVCEGAGSPAEINLRDGDLVNMGLARAAGLPVIVVADIDRGGVFASLLGTLALLDPADQAHVAGFVINKFRGDAGLLAPGLERLEAQTGRPVLGVLPHVEDVWLDVEDSLALEGGPPEAPARAGTLEVAVIRLRWMSNFTDADALSAEPGVRVRFTRSPADVQRADLVVVPGTKATIEDLERLAATGLDRALVARAAAGAPILGVCGGYQLLGERIEDEVESRRGAVPGLGLLPVTTTFAPDKVLRRRSGRCDWLGTGAGGYEIRHGRLRRRAGAESVVVADDGEPDGCRRGAVLGLSWHGALEHDEFRRALLSWVAGLRGLSFAPGSTPFAAVRGARLDALGDLVAENLDTECLVTLIGGGPPPDLPTVTTEVRECCAS